MDTHIIRKQTLNINSKQVIRQQPNQLIQNNQNIITQQKQMKRQTSSKNPSKSQTKQTKSIVSSQRPSELHRNISTDTKPLQLPINTITKQNYDVMYKKINITLIEPLEVKYVLKCVEGLFRNRSLYITTHKEGEIIGSGDAKSEGLTRQIQGVGLAPKHAKLKFNGVRKFYVKDYGSETGTWMKIPKQGIQIKHNDCYIIGSYLIRFQLSYPLNQIEQVCCLYNANQLSDVLIYNKITNLEELFKANYQNFKEYPFSSDQVGQLRKICEGCKSWFNPDKQNKLINMYYVTQQQGYSQQIGWQTKTLYPTILPQPPHPSPLAEIRLGHLHPISKVFSKITPDKPYQLNLHDQIKMGNLVFELKRFNSGVGEDVGFRDGMEDCYIIEEDIGGSQWKLISLFAVVDGYGGDQCMKHVKANLVSKVRDWTKLLDEAGDLNQMLRLLMSKTYYQLDYQFQQAHPDIANSCGATILTMLIIDSKCYVFNLGDNRGYLYRDEKIYKLSIDHIPSRVDEKARIQQAGGFLQYNRLNGKCTLSRALGQFQYKDINDYKNNMKGKLKSCLSCIPQVICFDIQPMNDEFILLSTDGILDSLNLKTVIDYINEKAANLESEENPDKILNSLIENCKISNPQCDNMAAVVIFIRRGKIGNKNSF